MSCSSRVVLVVHVAYKKGDLLSPERARAHYKYLMDDFDDDDDDDDEYDGGFPHAQ